MIIFNAVFAKDQVNIILVPAPTLLGITGYLSTSLATKVFQIVTLNVLSVHARFN